MRNKNLCSSIRTLSKSKRCQSSLMHSFRSKFFILFLRTTSIMLFVKTKEKLISSKKMLKSFKKKICKNWWEIKKKRLSWGSCSILMKLEIMISCPSIKLIFKVNHSNKRLLILMKLLIFIMICLSSVQVFKSKTLMDLKQNQIKYPIQTDAW